MSKKQVNFFRLVESYRKGGINAIKHLPLGFQTKVIETSNRILDGHLQKLLDNSEVKVGTWVLVAPRMKDSNNKQISKFLTKVTEINHNSKTFKFNEVFNLNGEKMIPIRVRSYDQFLTFGYLDWIMESREDKSGLIK